MNLLQLEYFMSLSKLGGFRATAEQLYVSQPAISKQISALEHELGVRLFYRNYRSVTLTPSGKVVLDALKQSKTIWEDALKQARILEPGHVAELRIGVFESADLGNFFDLAAEFQHSRRDAFLYIERSPVSKLALQFPGGKYDLIITHDYALQNRNNIDYRILACRQHVGLIAKEHPLAARPGLCFSDFRKERFYVPAAEHDKLTLDYCSYICAAHGFAPREMMPLPNIESVLLAVKMGLGVAVLDDLISLSPSLSIQAVPTDLSTSVVMAWHSDNRNPLISLFADEVSSHFKC